MKPRGGYRTIALVLFPLFLFAILILAGIAKTVLVLEIGGADVLVPVSERDHFVHTYVDSMYGATVREKFRIEDRCFRLIQVMTESGAVLAYLGIESKDEPNVERTLREFTIPAASVGNHAIEFRGANFPLGTQEGRHERIRVSVRRVSILDYLAHLVWS